MAEFTVKVGDDHLVFSTSEPGEPKKLVATIESGENTIAGSPSDWQDVRIKIAALMNALDGSRTDTP